MIGQGICTVHWRLRGHLGPKTGSEFGIIEEAEFFATITIMQQQHTLDFASKINFVFAFSHTKNEALLK